MLYEKVWLVFAFIAFVEAATRLNEYIHHYEPLSYDNSLIESHHLRAKRSLQDPFVHIEFNAHGRHFNLRLRSKRTVFSDNLVVDTPNGVLKNFDTSHLYSGSLWGESDTYVFGSIRDGVFDGKIYTPRGNYYVERANKYFNPGNFDEFHSVIYSENDVKDLHNHNGEHSSSGCGINEEIKRWMESIQNAPSTEILEGRDDNDALDDVKDANKTVHTSWLPLKVVSANSASFAYSREAQEIGEKPAVSRAKREVPLARACSLYIQTDPLLWEHIHDKENNDVKTREEIASLIDQHVKAVNHIYENVDFNGRRGIKFVVQRITINDSSSCDNESKRMQNPFCSRNIDVSNFLNLNSQMNHNAFCLAYVFTYRDFTGGTLGLAWVASPQGASGGICEKYKAYTENSGGRHVQTKRSLNTGIITFVNYNNRVPPKVSQLTLAHEIGHNFGSPHDWPRDCRPGGQEGNFIMFASATSGDRPNNNKFSVCSIRNITSVLEAVMNNRGGKENCFLEEDGPFCGNRIVEEGEQCDCGYNAEECLEDCCYPRDIPPALLEANQQARPCSRRNGAACSPSEGPCCTGDCHYEGMKICRPDSDCNEESRCDGQSARCPQSSAKRNLTDCNKNTQVCLNGECIGSICLRHHMEECFLTRSSGVTPEQLCEVACQQPKRPETCQSTFQHNGIFRNTSGIKLRPGSPCDNFQGYCDVFQKCRSVDAEGPLARLKNLLLSQKTLSTIAQWVTENWWAVLLMGITFVVVMGIFIKCCAVHTPSSNPKQPPALRFSETLRNPAQTLRRKRNRNHQTAPQSGQAPPPYPGRSRQQPQQSRPQSQNFSGGEGRSHHGRSKNNAPAHRGWQNGEPYSAAYPGANAMEMRLHPPPQRL